MNFLERFNLRKMRYNDTKRSQKALDELIKEIDDVKKEIDTVRCNFNNVTDADSIDYYTYMLKAYQIKHDMLIKQLKASFV